MSPTTKLKSTSDQTSAEYLAERVIDAYETLDDADYELIASLYTDDVYFEDPSHGIQGKQPLLAYFKKLLTNANSCKFKFHNQLMNQSDVFLSWTLFLNHPRLNNGETIRVDGTSFLKTRNGKIYYHRDYFDMGALIYEHVPIMGRIVKRIRLNLGR